ncbi:MAG: hypothetical protein CME48_02960 [Halieaceae bacterium]|nr:hypothetical protein [Halieaceae bacterium]
MHIKPLLRACGRYVLLPLLLVAIGAFAAAAFLLDAGRSANANMEWYGSANGILEEDYVELGGHPQYIRIRGRDRNNPVLLDLHGGPGGAQSGMTHRIARPLTDYFTLVEWDQRGAGKSAGDDSLIPTMSYQRMVDDTVELIEHLQQRLGVEKLILVGHSWGSMLGIGVIQARPDLIAAYVGVGQALAWNPAFDETKRLVLEAARAAGDTDVIESLEALPDQWPDALEDHYFDRIVAIQKPLARYGAGFHAGLETNLMKTDLVLDAILSPLVGLGELLAMLAPSDANMALIKDLQHRDFREQLGTDYKVPVFIFQGERDWQTPTSLVKPWFASLSAPHKEYVAFEDSAHLVINEEAGKYLVELVNRVRPFALK